MWTRSGKERLSNSGLDEGGRRSKSCWNDAADGMAAVAPSGRVTVPEVGLDIDAAARECLTSVASPSWG